MEQQSRRGGYAVESIRYDEERIRPLRRDCSEQELEETLVQCLVASTMKLRAAASHGEHSTLIWERFEDDEDALRDWHGEIEREIRARVRNGSAYRTLMTCHHYLSGQNIDDIKQIVSANQCSAFAEDIQTLLAIAKLATLAFESSQMNDLFSVSTLPLHLLLLKTLTYLKIEFTTQAQDLIDVLAGELRTPASGIGLPEFALLAGIGYSTAKSLTSKTGIERSGLATRLEHGELAIEPQSVAQWLLANQPSQHRILRKSEQMITTTPQANEHVTPTDSYIVTMMHNADTSKHATSFVLVTHLGEVLFAERMKDRDTGTYTFRLSKGGKKGNTKENTIFEDDEISAKNMVIRDGLAIRAASLDGKRKGLFKLSAREIAFVASMEGDQIVRHSRR